MKAKSDFCLTHDVYSALVPMSFSCANLLDEDLVTCDVVSAGASKKGMWAYQQGHWVAFQPSRVLEG